MTVRIAIFVSNTWQRNKFIYWQYDEAISVPRGQDDKTPTPKYAVRDGDYKLLIDREFKSVELYNLRLDPGETNDLSQKEFKRWRSEDGSNDLSMSV